MKTRLILFFIGLTLGVVSTAAAGIVAFDGNEYAISGISIGSCDPCTWTFSVKEKLGKDLSHWNMGLAGKDADGNWEVVDFSEYSAYITGTGGPGDVEIGKDGSTGFYGVKWDLDESFTEGEFTVGFNYDDFVANYNGDLSDISFQVQAKAGDASGTLILDGTVLDCDTTTTPTDPVPEPATMVLLGCGLVGLAGFGRKKLTK